MKKRLISGILILVIIVAGGFTAFAEDSTQISGIVGQFKLYFNNVLDHNDDTPNYYYSEEKQQYLPLTIVHEQRIYVPIELLNGNLKYTIDPLKNSIYFETRPEVAPTPAPTPQVQKPTVTDSVYKNNVDTTSNNDVKVNNNEIKFSDNDLNFSKYANFKVGTDTKSKFYSFYSKWIKHSEMINKTDHKITFYEVEEFMNYHLFDIEMIYDVRTNKVKDVTFMEWSDQPDNPEFKTYRGITTGSLVKDIIKAYGDSYKTYDVKDPNGLKMVEMRYNFYTDSYEDGLYTKGTISFFTYRNKSKQFEDEDIVGIRLKVD